MIINHFVYMFLLLTLLKREVEKERWRKSERDWERENERGREKKRERVREIWRTKKKKNIIKFKSTRPRNLLCWLCNNMANRYNRQFGFGIHRGSRIYLMRTNRPGRDERLNFVSMLAAAKIVVGSLGRPPRLLYFAPGRFSTSTVAGK